MSKKEKDGFVVMYKINGVIHPIISNQDNEELLNKVIQTTLENKVNITKNPINIKDGIVTSTIEDLFEKKKPVKNENNYGILSGGFKNLEDQDRGYLDSDDFENSNPGDDD